MRAERPLPTDIERRIALLAEAWRNDPDVAALYLFGSRARDGAAATSDVDLGVTLRDGLGADVRWRKRLALIGDATARLATDAVDVVVLDDAPSVLGHRILATGRLLLDTNPRRRSDVAEGLMRRYLDEAYLRRVLDAGLARRIDEGAFGR